MVFIFTLEMQLPSGINTIQTGCLACKLKRSEQHTKQQERAQRITEDKCKREHEEQDQAVKEKMSREDESGVHRDHR